MIQDIAPHVYHNEYHPLPPSPESYILCYYEKQILIKWVNKEITYPTFAELEQENEGIYENCQYLFSIDDKRYYLLEHLVWPKGQNYTFENIEIFRTSQSGHLAFAGVTGSQLYRWYQDHLFCGHCQEPMVHSDKERMVYCPKCGRMEYPKLCPAVIVAVTHGNRLLLSKYAGRGHTNYALIAGFAEIGETIEETVKREVMEEVGLKVKNLRYYKSQPWSFTDTLLFGFYVDLDGEEDITLDQEELALAQWFDRDKLPEPAANGSLTSEMITMFRNGEK